MNKVKSHTAAVSLAAYLFLLALTSFHHHDIFIYFDRCEEISVPKEYDAYSRLNYKNCPIHSVFANTFSLLKTDSVLHSYFYSFPIEFNFTEQFVSPAELNSYNLRAPPAV